MVTRGAPATPVNSVTEGTTIESRIPNAKHTAAEIRHVVCLAGTSRNLLQTWQQLDKLANLDKLDW